MAIAVLVQRAEYVGVEQRDPLQDARLDVVHLRVGAEPHAVVLHRAALELLEGGFDLRGVVRF